MNKISIKRAIVSVTDKTGVVDLAKFLQLNGVEIVSTGGTAKTLIEAGINVIEASDVTKFPEILDGRVKTLHPNIHGGILANKQIPAHMETLKQHNIKPFDLVCVNLYNFFDAVNKKLSLESTIEQIDIGGPCMLRAAAKNYSSILVIPDPKFYPEVIKELTENSMQVSQELRAKLAAYTFEQTSKYDSAIASYLSSFLNN